MFHLISRPFCETRAKSKDSRGSWTIRFWNRVYITRRLHSEWRCCFLYKRSRLRRAKETQILSINSTSPRLRATLRVLNIYIYYLYSCPFNEKTNSASCKYYICIFNFFIIICSTKYVPNTSCNWLESNNDYITSVVRKLRLLFVLFSLFLIVFFFFLFQLN